MNGTIKTIFLLVVLPAILAEALLVGPWVAERLLRWGARWLPEESRQRYTEDWLGELDAVPGSLTKLGFAIQVLLRVPATQRALTDRDVLWVLVAKRLLASGGAGLLMVVAMVLLRLGSQVGGNPERARAFERLFRQGLTRPPRRARRRSRSLVPDDRPWQDRPEFGTGKYQRIERGEDRDLPDSVLGKVLREKWLGQNEE
jgi:hypothetical protein